MNATREGQPAPAATNPPRTCELSVIMPCLNEADTLAACINTAKRTLDENAVDSEIIVADNGSTDESPAIARALGARVVDVPTPGYGQALRAGLAAARGRFALMGDADDSYDFGEIPRFLAELRNGADLVLGCRLPAGGGRVLPGAMPFLHRWVGNPGFSWLARRWFWAPIHDVNCGLRAVRLEFYDGLRTEACGMEFAVELIVRASLKRAASIREIPITLRPDGRRTHPRHLRTFRDGWRTLRFFLLYRPKLLFLLPGFSLLALGAVGYALGMPAVRIGSVRFGVHTLVVASLAVLLGQQAIVFGIFSKVVAVHEKLLPPDPRLSRFLQVATLERTLVVGAAAVVAGAALVATAFMDWGLRSFGDLDFEVTLRWLLPGTMLVAAGAQLTLAALFACVFQRWRD